MALRSTPPPASTLQARQIDVWKRTPDGWIEVVSRNGETANIDTLSVGLPLDDVYRDLVS